MKILDYFDKKKINYHKINLISVIKVKKITNLYLIY
jgi:hypothetical protein